MIRKFASYESLIPSWDNKKWENIIDYTYMLFLFAKIFSFHVIDNIEALVISYIVYFKTLHK